MSSPCFPVGSSDGVQFAAMVFDLGSATASHFSRSFGTVMVRVVSLRFARAWLWRMPLQMLSRRLLSFATLLCLISVSPRFIPGLISVSHSPQCSPEQTLCFSIGWFQRDG